ncbi:SIMPL domain-containing protein [Luteimonas sp. RC10]|uniref:SIMPL domain-containing protein n=1 Tax=Luteimonas sp. RC10 TaxID=2587035 RepID=UPI00161A7622|nr:SIMPL domain-containing protein [Luteimonas sp. RC10]
MRPNPLRPLLLACSLALGTVSMTATAQDPQATAPADGTMLSISARAEASRVPDIATLSTGVVTQAADANGAMRANAEQMTRLTAAIKAAGIAERDVQTSGINLSPQYHYAENQPPTITGYQASNTVNLKVRDLRRLGSVLDALVANGANQINGPTFEIDNAEAVEDEARAAALKLAQQRAELYANSLGMRVRRIVSISEGGGFAPPRPAMAMRMVAQDASTPIAPGESSLSANLNVVFELGR